MAFCFTLTELSSRWKCTENDVLEMAIDGKLKLSVNLNGCTHPVVGDAPFLGWVELMLPGEISGFFPNREDAYFSVFHRPSTPDGDFVRLKTHSGEIGYYHLTRSNIVVMNAEVVRVEESHPELVALNKPVNKPVTATPDENRIESKKPLPQAVEKLFRYLYEKADYGTIQPDGVNDFIKKLDSVIKQDQQKDGEFPKVLVDYIVERVEKVKFSRNGGATITTTEFQAEGPNGSKNTHKSTDYFKKDVTKKLCLLRKKHPFPL